MEKTDQGKTDGEHRKSFLQSLGKVREKTFKTKSSSSKNPIKAFKPLSYNLTPSRLIKEIEILGLQFNVPVSFAGKQFSATAKINPVTQFLQALGITDLEIGKKFFENWFANWEIFIAKYPEEIKKMGFNPTYWRKALPSTTIKQFLDLEQVNEGSSNTDLQELLNYLKISTITSSQRAALNALLFTNNRLFRDDIDGFVSKFQSVITKTLSR